jgi:hypothetical protein
VIEETPTVELLAVDASSILRKVKRKKAQAHGCSRVSEVAGLFSAVKDLVGSSSEWIVQLIARPNSLSGAS